MRNKFYRFTKIKLLMLLTIFVGMQASIAQTLSDEPATVTWPFGTGAAGQTATYSSGDEAYFKLDYVTLGSTTSVYEYNGSRTDADDGTTEYTLLLNSSGSSASNDNNADQRLAFAITPVTGLSFTPTNFYFDCQRFGTGSGLFTVVWKDASGTSTTITSLLKPNRDGSTPDGVDNFNMDLTGLGIAASSDVCFLEIYLLNSGATKELGVANVTVDGVLNGTVAAVTNYDLTTVASPVEGGSVAEFPLGGVHEDGSEVTVTATRNFGYEFTQWELAGNPGVSVSTSNPYVFNISGNTDLVAVFSTIPTYTVTTANSPAEGGSVEQTSSGAVYEGGDPVTLTALPSAAFGYAFTQWEDTSTPGVAISTDNPYTFDISANRDITAVYSVSDTYTVTWALTSDTQDAVDVADGDGWTAENQGAGSGVTQRSYDHNVNDVTCQRMRANDGSTDLPASFNADMYLEYTVTADAGYELTVDAVTMSIGARSSGGIQARISYSTDDFSTSTVLEETDFLPSSDLLDISHTDLGVATTNGGSFKVRVYPQINAPGTGKYLTGYNAKISFTSNAVIIWTGATDSDWGTASNWDGNAVPTASDNVMIPDVTNDPTISGDAAVNNISIEPGTVLTVQSGASLAIMGEADGDATIKRNSTGSAGYSIVGAPVSGVILDVLAADYVYGWDEQTGDWSSNLKVSTNSMTSGQGYFVGYDAASPEISVSGGLVSGNVSAAVTTGGIDNGSGAGWNLVANPYAAAISSDDVIGNTNNMSSTDGNIYLWMDGGSNSAGVRTGSYVVANSGNSLNIGSVQGFFVNSATGGTVDFTPDMQVTDVSANADGSFYRKASNDPQKVKLALTGNGLYNEIVMSFDENATFEKDYGWDAKYLQGSDLIAFYTLLDDAKYATQGLPKVESDPIEVNLGMDLKEAGQYKVSVEQFKGFGDVTVTLIDQVTGESYELNENVEVTFDSDAVLDARRFKVVVSPAKVLSTDQLKSSLKVFAGSSELTINFASSKNEWVSIYSLDGRSIFNKQVKFDSNQAVIKPQINRNQVYVLRVNNEAIKFVLK